MNDKEKYLKTIGVLKSNNPVLTDKERMTDDIMRKIRESSEQLSFQERLFTCFFGWVNVYWLRGTMAAAALFLAGFFIIQQIVIADRLDNLEKQLVRTLRTINDNEPDLGINQKVLLNLVLNDQLKEDSITVSTSDIEDLLNQYLKLRENYENMRQDAGLDPYIQNKIRQSLEKSTIDDEPKLKL